jgi:integrase
MRVLRHHDQASHSVSFALLDDAGEPVPAVAGFLGHLGARGYSPNTLSAYAHDLLHLVRFLGQRGLAFPDFTPVEAVALLEYLSQVPSRKRAQGLPAVGRLAPASVNRVLVAVSSFFEYLIVSGQLARAENPMQKAADLERVRVSERHRPAMGAASRQRPVRRVVRVRTVERLPRPLTDEQVAALLGSLRRWRDRALVLLMLQGGLRPGEVLNLHLEDLQYGRRRVVVRHRTDHPKGARTKSRHERVVDLHEPEALAAVSAYVMRERPADADTTLVFLVGGRGAKRREALSYQALVRLFARRCERLGIREPWLTPHALRHTHATKMWEGGMRELALQKRLGHASPESTRMYTRVSDPAVLAEYRRALRLADEQARP